MVDVAKLDDRLTDLALGRRPGTAVVLVEPDVARPRVRLSPDETMPGRRRPIGIERPQDPAKRRGVVDDLRALLAQLGGREPGWLEAGGVFVVELDGAALAALSDSPLVRRIHPNVRRTTT